MAEQLDWAIWGRDASVKAIVPDDTFFGYDLYNEPVASDPDCIRSSL